MNITTTEKRFKIKHFLIRHEGQKFNCAQLANELKITIPTMRNILSTFIKKPDGVEFVIIRSYKKKIPTKFYYFNQLTNKQKI